MYYDFIFYSNFWAAILKMANLFDSDRTILQLGDSDFRILQELSYKNEDVSIFY